MLVKFFSPWFAPSYSTPHDGDRVFSGVLYRKGTHSVPDELYDKLPKSAVIVDKGSVHIEEEVSKDDTLGSIDIERASSDMEEQVRQEAENIRTRGRPKKDS